MANKVRKDKKSIERYVMATNVQKGNKSTERFVDQIYEMLEDDGSFMDRANARSLANDFTYCSTCKTRVIPRLLSTFTDISIDHKFYCPKCATAKGVTFTGEIHLISSVAEIQKQFDLLAKKNRANLYVKK